MEPTRFVVISNGMITHRSDNPVIACDLAKKDSLYNSVTPQMVWTDQGPLYIYLNGHEYVERDSVPDCATCEREMEY